MLFLFFCLAITDETTCYLYTYISLCFYCIYCIYSGGSDGFVNIWDPFNKKRLCQFHKLPTSISSLSFSADGMLSLLQ